MMQTVSHHAPADRRMIISDSGHRGGPQRASLTPAERIALTIALLNRGLDLMGGFARTSLQGSRPGLFRGHHDPERNRHSLRAN